jgi:hypothetical protein
VEAVFAGIGGCRIDLHGMISINGADRAQTLLIAFQAGKAFPTFGRRLFDMLVYGALHNHTSLPQYILLSFMGVKIRIEPIIHLLNVCVLPSRAFPS